MELVENKVYRVPHEEEVAAFAGQPAAKGNGFCETKALHSKRMKTVTNREGSTVSTSGRQTKGLYCYRLLYPIKSLGMKNNPISHYDFSFFKIALIIPPY